MTVKNEFGHTEISRNEGCDAVLASSTSPTAMQDYLLMLGSVTEAMKAKRALASQGIKVKIQKASDEREGGCRYALIVSNPDLLRVTLVLRESNIPYRMGI